MKNKITTNNLRTIKKNFLRFLSLMLMSFLASVVFCGLTSTEPDFILTIDKYYDKYDTYDIKLISDKGLSLNDIDELKKIYLIENAEGVYSSDVLLDIKEESYVVNVSSLPKDINKLNVKEGRLPSSNNEIVLEENVFKQNDLNIGDTIIIDSDSLKIKEYVVVGSVQSSLYINNNEVDAGRGNTTIGGGTINYYSYVSSESFNADYYTYIYVTIKGAKEELTSRNSYDKLINDAISQIKEIQPDLEENRLEEIKKPLIDEVKKAKEDVLAHLEPYEKELEAAKKQLDAFYASLDENSPAYEIMFEQYTTLLENYNTELAAFNEQKENALKVINEAYEEINEIEKPNIYIHDRYDYLTYSEYIDNGQSIANISKIFPVVFFVVAILISLVSMNRMVEEDRNEIGTFKSLGMSNKQIMDKYLMFAFIATLLGCVLGCIAGSYSIPAIIITIYGILYDIPYLVLKIDITILLVSFIISCICICGTTYLTAKKVLKENPASLMRPKAPKNGKRVLLEKIKFIWNRLNFSNKVTVRNIFRYKKRVLTTIFGIAGCTGLMLCGFGLKDSIVDLPGIQYGDVFTFDAMVYVENYDKEVDYQIFENEKITSITNIQSINVSVGASNAQIMVSQDNQEIKNIINFYDYQTNEIKELENNKIIISDKLADLNNIKEGENLSFTYDSKVYTFEVSSIVEMYFGHYIFMDSNTLSLMDLEFIPNIVYLETIDLDEEGKEILQEELIKEEKVLNVAYTSYLLGKVEDMLTSLDKVILILIVLASALAFVVLYNLSNINILERRREIATLKVLGFYHKEVDKYITKETLILTLIGVLIGLLFGNVLTGFVLDTLELEQARFIHHIKWLSYGYASLLAFVFTFIVNYITHFSLKKIDMIESLKSVE